MQWSNVFHIYRREVRDQWRDRRTLFSVIFLPLLLYPILGMAMLQITQFMREKSTTVLVVGHDCLKTDQSLFSETGFQPQYTNLPEAKLTKLVFAEFSSDNVWVAAEQLSILGPTKSSSASRWRQLIQDEMNRHQVDALLFIAPASGYVAQANNALLTSQQDSSDQKAEDSAPEATSPQVQLFLNSSSDQSRVAGVRVEAVLGEWHQSRLKQTLAENDMPESMLRPFEYNSSDLAGSEVVSAHIWSKILPFILFIWTLTGSFYCAVDLCAGEKERGTLETLLCSPAKRREIVIGKLLTTMSFSSMSGLLNLTCTIVTGVMLARQMGASGANEMMASIGAPPIIAIFWLILGLIPISALFGAISIAIAAFARSSKEGQYYLMPILMVCLPLIIVPIVQGIEFDLGLSLIPVTGLMFLLRTLVEGDYLLAAKFAIPVIVVNGWCVHMAIGWAVRQFNDESVLFRPSEKFSFWKWIFNKIQQREALPTIGQVIVCGALILSLRFFLQIACVPPESWNQFAFQSTCMLVVAVAFPAMLMAFFFTSSPYQTLRLRINSIPAIGAALLLAIFFHPLIMGFQRMVVSLYPISGDFEGVHRTMMTLFADAPNMWYIFLVLAVLPAVCEELAFRGFILSGLQRIQKPGTVIVLSAVLFGITHGFLQQSIVATFTGVILGLLALKTGSLLPCIVFHATHNIITLQLPMMHTQTVERSRLLSFIFEIQKDENGVLTEISYNMVPSIIMIVLGLWILISLETWVEQDETAVLGPNLKPSFQGNG